MKEIYIAPELELLSLAPAERLAADKDVVDFYAVLNAGSSDEVISNQAIDIDVDLS